MFVMNSVPELVPSFPHSAAFFGMYKGTQLFSEETAMAEERRQPTAFPTFHAAVGL